jgi:hypothetical protein
MTVAVVGRPAPTRAVVGSARIPGHLRASRPHAGAATINYFMSGPDGGERFDGTWNVIEVDAPTSLVVEDAIVEDDGTPSDGNSMTRMEIDIEAVGDTSA